MIIVDANLLLYAYNADAPQQTAAARYLTGLFDGGEAVALPWLTICAFVRIATNARLWANPLPPQRVFAIIDEWLAQPGVIVLHPGPRHAGILKRLMVEHRATGPLVMDAVLAALAIENGAWLASSDQDFRRFPELRWLNPLSPSG